MIKLSKDLIGRRVRLLEKTRWLAGEVKGWSLGTLRFREFTTISGNTGGFFHVEFDNLETGAPPGWPSFGVGGEGGEVYFLDLAEDEDQ